ncbi:Glyco_18 protein [Aspergillus sp. HF37]|nr:Glyco_18 protein [Aspergillus sp. HF37]
MAWAIDLDDDKFSALSGLIGRDAGEGLDKSLAKSGMDSASWSSENDHVEPYTPVPIEYLFPDVPPVTYPTKWDLQILGGYNGAGGETQSQNPTANPGYGAFGFVLIAGPKEVVSSFSKRDGSHIELVDYPSITSSERQTTRLFCGYDGEDSNCDDVMEGGLEGTIVRMPDDYGPGSYVVAHSLKRSENQTLPGHLAKRMPASKTVMSLEFSYNFNLMKRADDKVYLRIDYSNMPGYWGKIVNAPGEKRKRSIHPRELSQRDLLDKRFFSPDSASWGEAFDDLSLTKYHTDFSEPAAEHIVNEELDCGDEAYLKIESDGECQTKAKFGFTMIGSLQPLSFEQAYGFIDLKFDLDTTVKVTGNSGMDTEYKTNPAHIVPNSDVIFSHPGIVNFKPSFDIQIGIKAKEASFSGDFTAHMRAGTDPALNSGWIRQTFPTSAGGTRGGVKAYSVSDSFEGHMKTDDGEVELSLIPAFKMNIAIGDQAVGITKRQNGDVQARQSVDSLLGYVFNIYSPSKLAWNAGGVNLMTDSSYYSLVNFGDDSIESWDSEETSGHRIGD